MSEDVKRIQAAIDRYRQAEGTDNEGQAIADLLDVVDAVKREHETKTRRA